jgi:subtilisin family serine protease
MDNNNNNNNEIHVKNGIEKKIGQAITISLFGLILFAGSIIGIMPVQITSSQLEGNTLSSSNMTDSTKNQITSTPENFASDLEVVNESQSFEFVPGQPIQQIPNSFIVKLKPIEEGGAFDTGSFEESISSDLESIGGNITATYDELGFLQIQLGEPQSLDALSDSNITLSEQEEQVLEDIMNNPAVEEVYNDAIVTIQAQVLPNDIDRVDADMSYAISGDGQGSVDADIGILDTGVQADHPDLNVFKCVSFVDNPTPTVPLNTCNDGQGHGTHVAGTAAAKDNDIGVVGKAPGARIWAIKVLSDSGSGSFSDILEGLNYVAQNANQIDVINLSLGGIGSFPPAEDAITKLIKNRGVVVVLAAGNSNMNAIGFTPAKTPAAITVSAMLDTDGKCGGGGTNHSYGSDDSFAPFSNYGAYAIDMAAPGVDILSTYKGSTYAKLSGTSMAAPNVAGAAALVKSMNPSATPAEVESFLKVEATPHSVDPIVGNPACNGNGKGYFDATNDDDNVREPLLYMK